MKEDQISQELMFKLSMFEQQMQQIQEQTQAIDQAILDSNSLCLGLDELKNSRDKEVFSSIGRGIFIRSKIVSDDLLVDVGGKTFVQKTIPETQSIIEEQLEKLEEAKNELEEKTQEINQELTKLMVQYQGEQEK